MDLTSIYGRISLHDISPDMHCLYRTTDTPPYSPSPPPFSPITLQRIDYHLVDAQLAAQVSFARYFLR